MGLPNEWNVTTKRVQEIIDSVQMHDFTSLGGERKLYIRTATGNDNNDGLSPATAFRTYSRAQAAIVGDFYEGYYIIDVTDCTFTEPVDFLNIRGPSIIRSTYLNEIAPDSYGSKLRSAINLRAELRTYAAFDPGWVTAISGTRGTVRYECVGQNFIPSEFVGKLIRTDTEIIPIIDNGVDWIDVPFIYQDFGSPPEPINEMIEPSCTWLTSGTNFITWHGIDGYTLFGIRFQGDGGGQNISIGYTRGLAFEACVLIDRMNIGGATNARFQRCLLYGGNSVFRVKGSQEAIIVKGCACAPNTNLVNWASPNNTIEDILYGCTLSLLVDRGIIPLSLGGAYEVLEVTSRFINLTIPGPSVIPGASILYQCYAEDITIERNGRMVAYGDASEIYRPVVRAGANFICTGGQLEDLTILPGGIAFVLIGITVSGSFTVGSQVVDPTTILVPTTIVSDGATLVFDVY